MATAKDLVQKHLAGRPALAAAVTGLVDQGKIDLISAETVELPPADQQMFALYPSVGSVGARQGRCGCGAFVWMSLTTQAAVAKRNGKVTLICEKCMLAVSQKIEQRAVQP